MTAHLLHINLSTFSETILPLSTPIIASHKEVSRKTHSALRSAEICPLGRTSGGPLSLAARFHSRN